MSLGPEINPNRNASVYLTYQIISVQVTGMLMVGILTLKYKHIIILIIIIILAVLLHYSHTDDPTSGEKYLVFKQNTNPEHIPVYLFGFT